MLYPESLRVQSHLASFAQRSAGKSGHDYDLLEKAISISILDFNLFPDNVELHSTFRLFDPKQDLLLTSDLELHYIELPKFTPDKAAKLRTRFEKWLYVLKFADLYHSRDLPKVLAQEEGLVGLYATRKGYTRDDIKLLSVTVLSQPAPSGFGGQVSDL